MTYRSRRPPAGRRTDIRNRGQRTEPVNTLWLLMTQNEDEKEKAEKEKEERDVKTRTRRKDQGR
jgi:hypothetical protein